MGAEPLSTLLVLGAGGHGRVVADAAVSQGLWRSVNATDRDPARCEGELLPGVPLSPLQACLASASAVHVAIGGAAARQAEAAALESGRLVSVTHPRASVSTHAQIGAGCFIAAQAVVAAGARLGVSVIVNHGAVVDHDCEVGSFTHIAPRCALGGAARVGSRVMLGTGTCVLPGVRICDDVVTGAGAVVHRDITLPGVYVGVPARRIK